MTFGLYKTFESFHEGNDRPVLFSILPLALLFSTLLDPILSWKHQDIFSEIKYSWYDFQLVLPVFST